MCSSTARRIFISQNALNVYFPQVEEDLSPEDSHLMIEIRTEVLISVLWCAGIDIQCNP